MATHDYSIANADGATVRADINNALAAIVSNNSSASEPATTYAYMWWADTTNGLLKIRNAADSAWIEAGDLTSTALGHADLDTAQTFTAGQRGEITTLTDGATITPDFNDSNNFTVTLGGNRTLANPSNLTAGQSGSVFLVQDGTGSRTLAFGSYWDFAGGTAPTLTTAAGAVDRIDYIVRSSTSIHAVFTANYS
jgi:hypothetical protein